MADHDIKLETAVRLSVLRGYHPDVTGYGIRRTNCRVVSQARLGARGKLDPRQSAYRENP